MTLETIVTRNMDDHKKTDLLAIFFDLDNTLIATRRADERTCDELTTYLHMKYAVPLDSATKICGRYLKMFRNCPDNPPMDLDSWRQYLWSEALGDHYKLLTAPVYQHWLALRYKHLALASDVKQLLKSLRGNYLLALVTNGPSSAQWEKVEKLNLKPFFDLILVSGDLPWEKPHPKIFLEACDALCVEPQQTVIVGDKLETDILGGINSKLGGTVWVPLCNQKLCETDPLPDYVVESVTDLYGLLPQIRRVMKKKSSGLTFRLNNVSLCDVDDCNSNGSDAS